MLIIDLLTKKTVLAKRLQAQSKWGLSEWAFRWNPAAEITKHHKWIHETMKNHIYKKNIFMTSEPKISYTCKGIILFIKIATVAEFKMMHKTINKNNNGEKSQIWNC